jgi:hypothetical protein
MVFKKSFWVIITTPSAWYNHLVGTMHLVSDELYSDRYYLVNKAPDEPKDEWKYISASHAERVPLELFERFVRLFLSGSSNNYSAPNRFNQSVVLDHETSREINVQNIPDSIFIDIGGGWGKTITDNKLDFSRIHNPEMAYKRQNEYSLPYVYALPPFKNERDRIAYVKSMEESAGNFYEEGLSNHINSVLPDSFNLLSAKEKQIYGHGLSDGAVYMLGKKVALTNQQNHYGVSLLEKLFKHLSGSTLTAAEAESLFADIQEFLNKK